MELKEGMYVRTNYGIKKIAKYEYQSYYENCHDIRFEGDIHGCVFTDKEIETLKPSHNIIDLIEKGDYVNGMKVDSISKTLVYHFYTNDMECAMREEDIKSIVTKEQFSSMEYRLGE